MKVKTETALLTVEHGSHLYGTNGPESDLDLKVVCLPTLDDLLLNTKLTNRRDKPGADDEKVGAGECETEYLPLQVFLDDFFNGQTYALEVTFAVLSGRAKFHAENRGVFLGIMFSELARRFLTGDVEKMVGYAVAQSRQYGLKTQRYTAMKTLVETVEKLSLVPTDQWADNLRPLDTPGLVSKLLELEHVNSVMIENANGGSELAPALEVCGKKFPYTNRWSTILASLRKSLATYGDRVKKFDGEGVDWKALAHAIRITDQVTELCQTGKLTFPRPNARTLREIKLGEHPVDSATTYLNECFDRMEKAVEACKLPQKTPELCEEFRDFKLYVLRVLYNLPHYHH